MPDDLRLTFGSYMYLDRTRGLETGEVSPEGIDLEVCFLGVNELFRRVAQGPGFDVAEMSMSTYMMMVADGDARLVGIPVFPSRAFRHGMIFVNDASGIVSPEDLRGSSVGLSEYQMTAALWVRAFLEHDYGVRPSEIQWWYGGYERPEYEERYSFEPPSDVSVQRIPTTETLVGMFEGGTIDALLTFAPHRFKRKPPRFRRLFPNFRQIEKEYFQRTSYFPIMHLLVLRRDIYETNRWVATSLLEAAIRSKRMGIGRLRSMDALAVTLPWIDDDLDEIDILFNGDAFPYGFERNRATLSAMTEYVYEQGLTRRKLTAEELFASETIEHPGDAMP